MKLETERLILRVPKPSDWKDLVEGLNDPDVSRVILTVPHPYKKKDATEWIRRIRKTFRKKKPELIQFVIELKSKKKVIGASGLSEINYFSGVSQSGSWIHKKYRGKGYITEAKVAINDFAFNKLKLVRIESIIHLKNKISSKMVKKFGYKYEGILRKAWKSRVTKKNIDVKVYGLLNTDWKKIRPKLIKYLKKINQK